MIGSTRCTGRDSALCSIKTFRCINPLTFQIQRQTLAYLFRAGAWPLVMVHNLGQRGLGNGDGSCHHRLRDAGLFQLLLQYQHAFLLSYR